MNTLKKQIRLPDIAVKIYDLLEPLDAGERSRVLQGVSGLLGEPDGQYPSGPTAPSLPASSVNATVPTTRVTGARAQAWVRKHGLTDELLERVFHFDGAVELIAMPPGENKRQQTINTYLLLGIQEFLVGDEPKFTEAAAVALCKRMGCHDGANHALTRSKFGNKIAGSKDTGYSLTVPGTDAAATLIKNL